MNIKGIKEAIVKVQEFGENDQRMVAFLNVDPDFSMADDEISKLLAQNLPSYMIPSFFQKSDGFPEDAKWKNQQEGALIGY